MKNSAMSRPCLKSDPEIAAAIDHEVSRQHEGLEMIASENFVSEAVLEAAGSVFTNKYAEGYPGKRYYGGCEFADVVENLARDRAKQLFGAEHANVQPHSGSQANMAAYWPCSSRATPSWALNLAHGGHLTHGHKLNFSGKTLPRSSPTASRKETETIDYDELEQIGGARTAQADHRRRQRLSRASSTSPACARSPTKSARCSWSTWRTSPDWSPAARIPRRCRTRTSSLRPRTKRCAVRAPA